MSIATGAEVGNPSLADVPFCSPLSAEEYAFVYWEEDEELGNHIPEQDCVDLLEWFKGQRVMTWVKVCLCVFFEGFQSVDIEANLSRLS